MEETRVIVSSFHDSLVSVVTVRTDATCIQTYSYRRPTRTTYRYCTDTVLHRHRYCRHQIYQLENGRDSECGEGGAGRVVRARAIRSALLLVVCASWIGKWRWRPRCFDSASSVVDHEINTVDTMKSCRNVSDHSPSL
jgi:hypothetical protein